MNWKISTARKNKTDIIKPKTPARQGNWNKKRTNKQTINQSVIWRTIPYNNNNNDDDWSSALNGQHWTFVSPSTNFKTDVENELHPGSRDRRRGFQIESISVIKSDHQLPLSRNFNRNFATSARRKQNLQKVNSINALDLSFFFSIPRVFSML